MVRLMALTDLGGRVAIPAIYEYFAGNLSRTLDADGEKVAYCFPVTNAGSITAIEFYVSTFTQCTNGLTVSVETVGTDGFPSGSNYGGSSPATGVSVSGTGWVTATLATGATATKGDRVAVVITFTNFATGDSLQFQTAAYAQASFGYPMVATYESSSWGWRAHQKLIGALKYGSTYYPDDPMFAGISASAYYRSTSGNDEFGNKFQLPIGCRVTGVWIDVAPSDANIRVRIYDSSDVVQASVTIGDTHEIASQTRRVGFIDFPSACELEADTVYRVAVEVLDDAAYLSFYSVNSAVSTREEAMPLGANYIRTYRNNGGSWTDDNTQQMCIGLIVDQFST